MLVDKTLKEFLKETESDSPAPGGGSVAALSGALAAALGTMVCNLTIGKDKFSDVSSELSEIRLKLKHKLDRLTTLIDEDANAFNDVMKAFKLPKETEEQKRLRSVAIQEGYKKAISVPLETAKLSLDCLSYLVVIVKKGNPNAITDVGTGALAAVTGVRGAVYNIKINLTSIEDEEYKVSLKKEVNELDNASLDFFRQINGEIEDVF